MTDIGKLLSEVMREVGYVQKDERNKAQGYKFASAKAVLTKVNHALSERGIAIGSQAELLDFHLTKMETDRGPKLRIDAVVRISLTFTLGDQSITVQGLGQGMDGGDKAVMKANTAALKYCVSNAFLISWGDDPEADEVAEQFIASADPAAHSIADQPQRDGQVEMFATMIGKSTTMEELKAVGLEIGEAGLTQPKAEILKTLYAARKLNVQR